VSYCVNPNCSRPENPDKATVCLACGHALKLKGSFAAIKPLGRGGFGATYLAVDESLPGHPPCVIKQLRPNTQSASVLKMARELFEREATTLGRIGNHPQIPRLLAYFEEAENFYLVQEYVEGETLKQEYERKGLFKEVDIIKVLSEMLPALGFMHQNGVIHRDIKPANIIRRKQDSQLVLIDFGAVSTQTNRASPSEEEGDGLHTSFAIGTPGFAPPEQMAMRPVYSSDIYATAMTCLYLLTGRSPKDFSHDPYTGEINWRAEVTMSENLAGIFNKMLQISVSQRFRTAEEVIAAMGAKSAPTITASKPASNPVTPSRSSSRSASRVSVGRSGLAQPTSKVDLANGSNQKAITPRTQSTRGWTKSGNIDEDSFTRTRDQTYISKDPDKELKGGRKVMAEYGHGKRNFANLDLTKASLSGATLSGIVMSRSKLVETDFCQSDLTNSSFIGAIMTQSKLNGTNLAHAKMQRAILTKADLGGASLHQADLREANLQSAYMSKADLSGADFGGANLKGAYMSQANLRGTNLCGADLKGARITDEQLATAKTNWATIRPDGSKKLF
jgi:serine/threonine protein kinase, bacterial